MAEMLVEQVCTPCRGGVPSLTCAEAERYRDQVRKWALLDDARLIRPAYRFGSFRDELTLAREVGELAEAEGHHPDVCFGWGYATVPLRIKKIKGLHENDFIMAAKVDRLAGGTGPYGSKDPSPSA